jgi:hypothetical protein
MIFMGWVGPPVAIVARTNGATMATPFLGGFAPLAPPPYFPDRDRVGAVPLTKR